MRQAQDKPITEEFNEGWEEGRHAADVELMQLRTEIERLRAALKPFVELADRKEYTLNDVPHELFINAKLAVCATKMRGAANVSHETTPVRLP